MEKTWRWFGKNDKITLGMLRQIGVEGIVTALHNIPNGDVWESENILEVQKTIEDAGLHWSVVESLPVSEEIKYAGKNRNMLIDNYMKSIENLGKAGIKIICYNFMPVIDWIRTDLNYKLDDETSTLYFDKIRFAYFDLYILNRKGAEADYSKEELEKVSKLANTITATEKDNLIDTIIVKTQGFINGNIKSGDNNPVDKFNNLLALYNNIDKYKLRENLRYFLNKIMPICEKYNVNMCIHPDDPPHQVLGLPRIVGNEKDIEWILKAVDNPCNGLTFCSGSLSSGRENDVTQMARKFSGRTHFVHLRSTNIFSDGNFIEAGHLEGRADIIELVRIFEKTNPLLPMRVDHGRLMLDDKDKGYNPGYSFHGRMLALGQIEGVIATVRRELEDAKLMTSNYNELHRQ